MDNYFEITLDNIVKEGMTTKAGYCDKRYIIYINKIKHMVHGWMVLDNETNSELTKGVSVCKK